MLDSFRFTRYTVSTSPNKDETAVRRYGPTLSVLASCRFLSCCVSQSQPFYVVSALLLCLYVSSFFWLIGSLQILHNLAALSLAVLRRSCEVLLFIIPYKVALTCESVDGMLKCVHSNECKLFQTPSSILLDYVRITWSFFYISFIKQSLQNVR